MTRFDFSEFDFSEGFERFHKGFFGNSADHVPFIQQSHEFNMKYSGINAREYYSNPEKLIYGSFRTTKDFGFETPDICWDSYNIEAEALGSTLITFDDLTPAIDNITPIVTTEKDLAALKPPVPGQSGRMGFAYDAASLYSDLTGEAPCLNCCGPFTLATQIMTFEDVILGIKDNPAFVHKVMTFVVDEVLAPYINEFAKRYPNMTANCGDAVASLPFITLDMSEEFAVQYVVRLRELTEGRACTDNWWGDAYVPDPTRFWLNKLQACPDYLKVQDPDLFQVGAQKAKDFAVEQNKPVLLGVSNNLLQDGPVEAIQQRIHEYLEVIEPGGQSLLYLCNLGGLTPVEHAKGAVEGIEMYRRGDRPWAGERLSGAIAEQDEAPATRAQEPQTAKAPAKNRPALSDAHEDLLDEIFNAVIDGVAEESFKGVTTALEEGIHFSTILDDALISAMEEVGSLFSDGVIFVPEMLLSARAMKSGLELLRPLLTKSKTKPRGLVMLATVQGDVHDIGKNLVGMMMEGAGFTVVDIGVNISPEDAIEKARELNPDIVGLSALLTTTMPSMGKIITAFRKAELPYPVIIGGAPVTQAFADAIGADGYAEDAPQAVELAKRLMISGANWRREQPAA